MTKTELHDLRAAIGAIIMAVDAIPPDPFHNIIKRNAEKALAILDKIEL